MTAPFWNPWVGEGPPPAGWAAAVAPEPYPWAEVAPEHAGLLPLAAAAAVEPLGKPVRVVLHWTAGDWDATFGEYHACVKGSGLYVPTRGLAVKGAHLWGRNSGSIGVSACGEAGATADRTGAPQGSRYPLTGLQIETMAKASAELLARFGLGPPGTKVATQKMRQEGDRLVPADGWVYTDVLVDHAEFARLDGYASERWDVATLMDVIRHKAAWYYDGLRSKRSIPEHTVGHR